MRPCLTPKASSRTWTIGHEAVGGARGVRHAPSGWSGSKVSSLTPTTKVASAPPQGAETMTNGAPPSMWRAAPSLEVNTPVDSTTTSTPRSPHGSLSGSRSPRTFSTSPSTEIPPSTAEILFGSCPSTESYFNRWAMVSREPRSFTATKSMSASIALAARKKFRPIRPNPLMPTRIAMPLSILSV